MLDGLVLEYGGCDEFPCMQKLRGWQVFECGGREQLEWMHLLCGREVLDHGGRDRRGRVCHGELCARAVRVRHFVCGLLRWDVLGCDRRDELCGMPGGGVRRRGGREQCKRVCELSGRVVFADRRERVYHLFSRGVLAGRGERMHGL